MSRDEEDALMEAAALVGREGGKLDVDYVELLNEDEPDGVVVGRNKAGAITMAMPRADYEALLAAARKP